MKELLQPLGRNTMLRSRDGADKAEVVNGDWSMQSCVPTMCGGLGFTLEVMRNI